MLVANVVMYFIMLSMWPLYKAGKTEITSAADAAEALRPLAGNSAGLLFAIGIVAVGFLAVPVMTTGAAYDLCQAFGWKKGLHAKPSDAKAFYATIVGLSVIGMSMNFLGINPIRMLVWAGIVQGFSLPPLMFLVMLMTNNRKVMGNQVNSRPLNILGWVTTVAICAATLGLVVSWLI